MEENRYTGILINDLDIKLHRQYFEEMVTLQGIKAKYSYPLKKERDLYGETDANYSVPEEVGCIFEEHPTIWTMRKLGWNAEMAEGRSVIHVPYDLPHLEAGCLFTIPSGLDHSAPRVFKVYRMSTRYIYPASVACEIGPIFDNQFETSNRVDYTRNDFNLLTEDDD